MAHDVLSPENDKPGYELLKVTRKYLDMIMYSNLDVQTEDTIVKGRESLASFAETLKVRVDYSFNPIDINVL